MNWQNSPSFSSPLLDSISWGTKFSQNDVSVHFLPWGFGAGGVTSEGFTSYEKAQFQKAFDAIEAVTNLSFNVVNSSFNADLRLVLDANFEVDSFTYGYFSPPGYDDFLASEGVGVFNGRLWDRFSGGDLEEGGNGYYTIMHELLHGVGMAHTHDNGGGSGILPGVSSGFGDYGNNNLNQGVYTMMSYNRGYYTGGPGSDPRFGVSDEVGLDYGFAAGPMAADIAVLQALYGANNNYNNGATNYVLPTGTGSGIYWSSIWDTGGVDAIRHDGAGAAEIDLRAATLSLEPGGGGFISAAANTPGGFTIANGVVIENAFGGTGNDTIEGNEVANILMGRAGNDSVSANGGDDTLIGGIGDDQLAGGAGRDRLVGGRGADTLEGGSQNDLLIGGGEEDILYGDDGNDILYGGTSIFGTSDQLFGDAGNDTLQGEGGFDVLDGGIGHDVLNGGNEGDTLYGRSGNDVLYGAAGFDVIYAGTGNDRGFGGDTKDWIYGEDGDDALYGQNGNDYVSGGAGNDLLHGNFDNDRLVGGNGADTLAGGWGNDLMTGGAQGDVFLFETGHGQDTVTDFAATLLQEVIDFRNIGALGNWTQVDAVTEQVGADVVISTGGANTIRLLNVDKNDLSELDFIF